tara:strand:- start:30 stop:398 length:369 start_codon:yes stop_codon:yes gene_type:complete
MKIYDVWYVKNDSKCLFQEFVEPRATHNYASVGTIKADNLERAFDKLQNPLEANMDFMGIASSRSMSVGDVLVDAETKTYHGCQNAGWVELTRESDNFFIKPEIVLDRENYKVVDGGSNEET